MRTHRNPDRGAVLAWSALLVVYLVWGSTYLAIRVGVRDLPPGIMAGVRYLIAGALLYPIAIRTGDDGPARRTDPAAASELGLRDRRPAAARDGQRRRQRRRADGPSGLAALLVATVPLWMVVFAVPIQHQRIRGRSGRAGARADRVAVLAGGGLGGGSRERRAARARRLGRVGSGRCSATGSPCRDGRWSAAAIEMLVGGVILLIAAAVGGEFSRADWGDVGATSWLALAWLILPGSILAFTAYGYALAHLPVSTVSTYAYVNPVVAVVLGAALLQETFGPREIVGAVLVVASVALTLHKPRGITDDENRLPSAPPLEPTTTRTANREADP